MRSLVEKLAAIAGMRRQRFLDSLSDKPRLHRTEPDRRLARAIAAQYRYVKCVWNEGKINHITACCGNIESYVSALVKFHELPFIFTHMEPRDAAYRFRPKLILSFQQEPDWDWLHEVDDRPVVLIDPPFHKIGQSILCEIAGFNPAVTIKLLDIILDRSFNGQHPIQVRNVHGTNSKDI